MTAQIIYKDFIAVTQISQATFSENKMAYEHTSCYVHDAMGMRQIVFLIGCLILSDRSSAAQLAKARLVPEASACSSALEGDTLTTWNDPYYKPLESIMYSESNPLVPGKTASIRWFIENERYKKDAMDWSFWWVNGKDYGVKITGDTTRSPAKEMYGREVVREVYWPVYVWPGPRNSPKNYETVDFSRIRIIENSVEGRRKSVEVQVNAGVGQPPKGYFFIDVNGKLVPAKTFNQQPIETACIECHAQTKGAKDPSEMTFNPWFLKKPEDFERVGYHSLTLSQALAENKQLMLRHLPRPYESSRSPFLKKW